MNWHEQHDAETALMLSEIRRFLKEKVRPAWEKFEEEERFPGWIVDEMAAFGLLKVGIPDKYEGLDKGTRFSSLVARELAYAWPSLHLAWSANASLAAVPIILAGTEEQKQKYLPRLASGKILGCYALTEDNAGSDAASLVTRATKTPTTWVLNGRKTFITNAADASLAVVFARTGEGRHDVSAFVLESKGRGLDYPGVTVRPISKQILRGSIFCEVNMDNVTLGEGALLGEVNRGFPIAMATLDGGRINIAAQAVGIGARVFDEALDYVRQREQFGKPVWENQAVQFDFAGWATELRAAWALVDQVSRLQDAGYAPITEMASCAKLFASTTAKRISSEAAEYFGAVGVTKEHWILSRVLDSFAPPIYEGTSNVQKMVIARELGKKQGP